MANATYHVATLAKTRARAGRSAAWIVREVGVATSEAKATSEVNALNAANTNEWIKYEVLTRIS